jgi:pilus assembly protein CpaB
VTGRRTLLVVAAILVAAIGTSLVWLYVQGADARALKEAQASVAMRPVFVSTFNGNAGDSVGQLKPQQVQVPESVAGRDAVAPEQVAQQKLSVGVVPGTILRSTMFTSGSASGVGDKLEAVSLTFTEPARVPAVLSNGDDVSLFALEAGKDARLVVPHVRVRYVGPSPTQAGVAQQIVTFETTSDQARAIVDLASQGLTPYLVVNGKGAEPKP